MNYTQEERQWIISSIDYFKDIIKKDRHNDEEELKYLKNLKHIINNSTEISYQDISFITKALRLHLKKYIQKKEDENEDEKEVIKEDDIPAVLILESILNKSESFLIRPNIK